MHQLILLEALNNMLVPVTTALRLYCQPAQWLDDASTEWYEIEWDDTVWSLLLQIEAREGIAATRTTMYLRENNSYLRMDTDDDVLHYRGNGRRLANHSIFWAAGVHCYDSRVLYRSAAAA